MGKNNTPGREKKKEKWEGGRSGPDEVTSNVAGNIRG